MPRIHYGWVITGLSTVANTLAWSVRSTFALFYVALLQEFDWGRAETALGYSLSWLLLLLFSPRVYWRLFELHNEALWPLQVPALLLGAAILAGATVVVNDEQRLDDLQERIDDLREDLPSTQEIREELPGS